MRAQGQFFRGLLTAMAVVCAGSSGAAQHAASTSVADPGLRRYVLSLSESLHIDVASLVLGPLPERVEQLDPQAQAAIPSTSQCYQSVQDMLRTSRPFTAAVQQALVSAPARVRASVGRFVGLLDTDAGSAVVPQAAREMPAATAADIERIREVRAGADPFAQTRALPALQVALAALPSKSQAAALQGEADLRAVMLRVLREPDSAWARHLVLQDATKRPAGCDAMLSERQRYRAQQTRSAIGDLPNAR